jgi:hypothetical protein
MNIKEVVVVPPKSWLPLTRQHNTGPHNSNKLDYFRKVNIFMPVTVAVRGLGRLVAGIVGSNPAQGMDVCPRLSVLCCPV